jgi:WD40 repeat protein
MLATGLAGYDHRLALWHAPTGRLLWKVPSKGRYDYLNDVGFAAGGAMLVTINGAGIVRCWDVATGLQKMTLPKGLAVGDKDDTSGETFGGIAFGQADAWWPSADPARSCSTTRSPGTGFGRFPGTRYGTPALSQDGRLLATGAENAIFVWDLTTGRRRFTLQGLSGRYRMAFSPDASRLLAGDGEPIRSSLGYADGS